MKTLALSLLLGSSPALATETGDLACLSRLHAVTDEFVGLIFGDDEKTLPTFNRKYFTAIQDVWSLCKTEQAGIPLKCIMKDDIYEHEPDCTQVDPATLSIPTKPPESYVPFYSVVLQDAISDGRCSVFASSIDKFTVVAIPEEPVNGLAAYQAGLRGRISRLASEACLGAFSVRQVSCTETRLGNAMALECKAGKSF